MDTATFFTIILAIIIAVIESFSAQEYPHSTNDTSLKECFDSIQKCTIPIQQSSYTSGVSNDYRSYIANIDHVCQDYRSFVDCLQPSLHLCQSQDVQLMINVSLSVWDYACSERGRTLLKEYHNSVCYEDPLKLYELEIAAQYCTTESLSLNPQETPEDVGPTCERLKDFFQCVARLTKEECGDAAGEFVMSIARRLKPLFTEQDCKLEDNV